MSNLVWIDCEMTGLSVADDALIEVACLITDSDLQQIGPGVHAVIKPPAAALSQMSDFVTQMHEASGLLAELDNGIELADAEALLVAHIKQYGGPGKPLLAGNSVGMDRLFLEKYMPTATSLLHYRIVDVSSIKELVRRWYPRVFFQAPEKLGGHRALGDIQDSINELRYYREAVFVPLPGPDSATAKQMSAGITANSKD